MTERTFWKRRSTDFSVDQLSSRCKVVETYYCHPLPTASYLVLLTAILTASHFDPLPVWPPISLTACQFDRLSVWPPASLTAYNQYYNSATQTYSKLQVKIKMSFFLF